MLEAARSGEVDAALLAFDLHRLTRDRLSELRRRRVPLVLLTPYPDGDDASGDHPGGPRLIPGGPGVEGAGDGGLEALSPVHLVHLDAVPDEVLEALLLAVRQAPAPWPPAWPRPGAGPWREAGRRWGAAAGRRPHVPNGAAGWPRPGGTAPGGADAAPGGRPGREPAGGPRPDHHRRRGGAGEPGVHHRRHQPGGRPGGGRAHRLCRRQPDAERRRVPGRRSAEEPLHAGPRRSPDPPGVGAGPHPGAAAPPPAEHAGGHPGRRAEARDVGRRAGRLHRAPPGRAAPALPLRGAGRRPPAPGRRSRALGRFRAGGRPGAVRDRHRPGGDVAGADGPGGLWVRSDRCVARTAGRPSPSSSTATTGATTTPAPRSSGPSISRRVPSSRSTTGRRSGRLPPSARWCSTTAAGPAGPWSPWPSASIPGGSFSLRKRTADEGGRFGARAGDHRDGHSRLVDGGAAAPHRGRERRRRPAQNEGRPGGRGPGAQRWGAPGRQAAAHRRRRAPGADGAHGGCDATAPPRRRDAPDVARGGPEDSPRRPAAAGAGPIPGL